MAKPRDQGHPSRALTRKGERAASRRCEASGAGTEGPNLDRRKPVQILRGQVRNPARRLIVARRWDGRDGIESVFGDEAPLR